MDVFDLTVNICDVTTDVCDVTVELCDTELCDVTWIYAMSP